ncbi:hypothetical protein ACFZCX_25800 [Streptomyces canus]|uniref:hypothetical protein n=1 Tax=Streptomyces canus TaxID=58343 RepID=UPI0036ED2FFF
MAVSLAGCTNDHDDAGTPPRTSAQQAVPSPTKSSAPDSVEHIPGETVTKAPVFLDGKAAVQTANVRGSEELEVPGGLKAGHLAILVNCQGEGTLTVSVQPVGLSFPLECVKGEVSSIFNQMDLTNAHTYGTVKVTASSRIRWALTVGQ